MNRFELPVRVLVTHDSIKRLNLKTLRHIVYVLHDRRHTATVNRFTVQQWIHVNVYDCKRFLIVISTRRRRLRVTCEQIILTFDSSLRKSHCGLWEFPRDERQTRVVLAHKIIIELSWYFWIIIHLVLVDERVATRVRSLGPETRRLARDPHVEISKTINVKPQEPLPPSRDDRGGCTAVRSPIRGREKRTDDWNDHG